MTVLIDHWTKLLLLDLSRTPPKALRLGAGVAPGSFSDTVGKTAIVLTWNGCC